MEKILLALDPYELETNTIDFGCYIARLTGSKLTGVFLENVLEAGMSRERGTITAGMGRSQQGSGGEDVMTEDPVGWNIGRYKESCMCRGITGLVHRDRGVPLSEVIEESRFADLIIVDPITSFSKTDRNVPSRFVKDVLQDSECPVLIAPYSFEGLDTVIFTYNGSQSSVFAIKQFTYLFPRLSDKKAIVLTVNSKETESIEQQFKMKEWLKAHYKDVEFVVLKGDASDEIFGYLIEKKNAMVVMGAYGRNMLSRFFHSSHARLIVKTINLPVFITHH